MIANPLEQRMNEAMIRQQNPGYTPAYLAKMQHRATPEHLNKLNIGVNRQEPAVAPPLQGEVSFQGDEANLLRQRIRESLAREESLRIGLNEAVQQRMQMADRLQPKDDEIRELKAQLFDAVRENEQLRRKVKK